MEVKNLTFGYDKNKKSILNNVSFKISKGKVTTIIGSNGSGKSTLFNIMTKNLNFKNGEVLLNGVNIKNIKLKEFAKKVAIIHQQNIAPNDLKVKDLIKYGRMPHKSIYKKFNESDYKIIENVMNMTDLYDLQNYYISDLSGGQKQRVFIAMALAQNTEILFLDEPTTYLDIKYQIEILELIKKLNKENKITIIMVLHDINQAIKYSDEIIALKQGKVFLNGSIEEVVKKENIKEIFNIDIEVLDVFGKKTIIF